MYKFIPYEPFEVEALNTWVNSLAHGKAGHGSG